jgi:uncharacterized protein (DUF2141 family)
MQPYKFILPFLTLLIYSCASIVSPTGGPKDETPPVCTKKVPTDNTIKFNASSIDFYFDEFVSLNDITNQFLISPPLEKAPDIKLKGKKVSIVFNEDLKPNTTYTLNFGNGIVDYTEANQLQGLSYTFSTGDYIDSLTLNGNVIDGFTMLPEKDIAIGLYEINKDSTIFKNKPYYLVKPDSLGNFKFKYLRPAEYELVAFEDVNKNLKIEQNERLAFASSKIKLSYEALDSSVHQLILSPQRITRKPQVITAKELSKGKYEITATGTNCILNVIDNGNNKKENFISSVEGENCDTLYVYTDNDCKDSVSFNIQVDTVIENVIINCNSKQYDKFSIKSQLNSSNYDFLLPFKLSFTNPVFEIRETAIKLMEDSVEVTKYTITKDTNSPLNLYINYKWNAEKTYTIKLLKGSIKDIYGLEVDSALATIKTAAATTFGNLSINVVDKDSVPFIVQLMNSEGKIIVKNYINHSKSIQYNNLLPGHYFVKIIYDTNQNNKWDGGDYFIKQQPEKVFVSKQSVEVRANWDLTDIEIDPEL